MRLPARGYEAPVVGDILAFVRRHPVATLLATAAVGFLIGRAALRPAPRRLRREDRGFPSMNVGRARTYDPDDGHPRYDPLETRSDLSPRA